MLIESISSANRNIIQGGTYTFTNEPYMTANFIAVDDASSEGDKKIYMKQVVKQWRGVVHYSKVYEYVGLSLTAANSGATTVQEAYTQSVTKYGLGIYVDSSGQSGTSTSYFMMLAVGTASQCFAEATVQHTGGRMYSLQVRVNATIDMYTARDAAAPSSNQLKALVSSIANFPEG